MKRGTRTRPEKKMKEERQQQAEVARAIGQVREEEDRARHSFVRARVQDLPQTPRGGEGRGKQICTTSELNITAQSRGERLGTNSPITSVGLIRLREPSGGRKEK